MWIYAAALSIPAAIKAAPSLNATILAFLGLISAAIAGLLWNLDDMRGHADETQN